MPDSAADKPPNITRNRYATSSTSALICDPFIAWTCVVVNALPCVVVSALMSATLMPAIAAVESAGIPVVLDSALKLVVVRPAT